MDNEALVARLRRLEDLEALRRLKADYCELCDRGAPGERIAELFADDAEIEIAPSGERARGRAAIAAFYAALGGRFLRAAHLLANPRLEVEGDDARGRWWILMPALDGRAGAPRERLLLAEYDEQYRRLDGAWRIRRMRVDLSGWIGERGGA
jgi:hypothetical protein